jgi:anthranilate phosphoribosyltransferase
MLGPLVNPSQPQNQLVGVYNLEVARTYNYLLQKTPLNYGVLYALDGYDEISLTGPFKLFMKQSEQTVHPSDLGLQTLDPSAIFGGNSVPEAALIFKRILEGKGTEAQNNVVLANAAFALKILDASKSFEAAYQEAKDALLGLKALKSLKLLVAN